MCWSISWAHRPMIRSSGGKVPMAVSGTQAAPIRQLPQFPVLMPPPPQVLPPSQACLRSEAHMPGCQPPSLFACIHIFPTLSEKHDHMSN